MRTIQTDVIVRIDPKKNKGKKPEKPPSPEEAYCKLCNFAYIHTLLADKISEKVKEEFSLIDRILETQNQPQNSTSTESEQKQGQGWLPKGLVEELYNSLTETPPFAGMSDRFRQSVIGQVETTFKSWLSSRRNLIRRIKGKQRWLSVVESDTHLAEVSNYSEFEIENQAEQILAQAELGNEADDSSDGKLLNFLLEEFDATEDMLKRRAIILLLKNNGKVRVEPKKPRKPKNSRKLKSAEKCKGSRKYREQDNSLEPTTLEERLEAKRIEIERLKKRLLSQLPRARNLFPDLAYEESLASLIALPAPDLVKHFYYQFLFFSLVEYATSTQIYLQLSSYLLQAIRVEGERVESQFYSWYDSIPSKVGDFLRQPKFLPYPIGFLCDDVRSWEINKSGKISFKINGWGDLTFEVRCHRRQLGLIKTFLKDWQTKKQSEKKRKKAQTKDQSENERKNDVKYSGSLMLLRSIKLVWKPTKTSEQRNTSLCSKCESFQHYQGQGFWNECKLSIHWTYDPEGLTQQGLEKIRERKLEPQLESLRKKLEELEEKQKLLSSLEQEVPATSRSKAKIRKIESLKKVIEKLQADLAKPPNPKLRCLQNSPLFDRPDRPLYKGIPHIFVGVLLDLDKHLVVIVVDAKRGKELTRRNVRSILKEDYSLLQKYFRQRQDHSKQRQQDQREHRHIHLTESGLGQQVARLCAKRIVKLAQEYKASTIVLPETGGWRDRLYSQLVARAKIQCKGIKKAMDKYTKEHGKRLHQWDYSRLSEAIVDRAVTDGLETIKYRTEFAEDVYQQAKNLTVVAYNSLNSAEE